MDSIFFSNKHYYIAVCCAQKTYQMHYGRQKYISISPELSCNVFLIELVSILLSF